jgi:hypothetical protein
MNRAIRGFFLLALAAAAAPRGMRAQAPVAAAFDERAAFERLKSLADWKGFATGNAEVRYRVVGAGNELLETQLPGSDHEMVSVFYLDHGHLVLTHYCALGNQPHLRLDTAASSPDRLVFALDGGTNLDPAKDAHLDSGTITLKPDRMESHWLVVKGGKLVFTDDFQLSPK